ncbi:MAG: HlyC/CorC family transporter, partial [Proteobacteria bacterium]|nr:HlyC/CorC family transporter [Pseudomonadota bacterium]
MDDSSSNAAGQAPRSTETRPRGERANPSLLQAIRGWLRHTLGARHDTSLKEALEEAIEEHEEQAEERLPPAERLMLHNVLSFGEIKVSDIMVPRADIAAVAHDIEWPELTTHINEMRHTRIPVYEDTLDRMLGFIHVKDLLPMLSGENFKISRVLRPLLFVPPSMRVIDLLVMMRQAGSHMAIVVDEYGGTDGLVTMEDVFEEIVGDIQDEHDEADQDSEDKITRVGDTTFEVSARIPIETLESELNLTLVNEEGEAGFDTLGGLIFFQLGRVPVRGELVRHSSGVRFEIIEADPRRIRRVR